MRHITRLLMIISFTMLTACAPLGFEFTGLSSNGEVAIPRSPVSVVETFFTAWNTNDIENMYRTLSEASRTRYSYETFERLYSVLANEIGFEGAAVTISDHYIQGTTAAVSYDMTLQSSLFGEINETGRTIRLINEPNGWRLAWSTMDIFEGFTVDSRIAVETETIPRANIYDRDGDPLVIENGSVSALFVSREVMSDVDECQALIANLTYTPLPEFRQYMDAYNFDTFVYVGEIDDYIEQEYATQLNDICGMNRENRTIIPRRTRQYIGQGAAVHATGYIGPIPQEPESERNRWLARGYSEGDLIGRAGVELQYETQLAGQPPRVLRITEPGGIVLKELGRTDGVPPRPVYMTIDRDLQIETARAVAWGYNYAANNWAAPDISPGGGAIVIDVNTGAILAMASFPTFQPGLFNPDSFATDRGQLLANLVNDQRQPLKNRVTQDQVSPGSVFKIITTAAVINEGLATPQSSFYCDLTWDGSQTYGDTFSPRSDWRLTDGLEATGQIVPSQALTSSCDPWYYEFGARLYRELEANIVERYTRRMGLASPTGIGIYPEAPGIIPVPESVEEAINNAIGQGDTQVTVLQTARMVAAVANGGTIYKPYIVQQVGEGDEVVFRAEPEIVGEYGFDSPIPLDVVRRGMCEVITDPEKGTANWVFRRDDSPAPYTVCGKTGTAQAGYAPNAWFVAYAPAENPQIAVVAMARNSREGSEVPAPMVRRILDAYFNAPYAPFPEWWEFEYVPLEVPTGGVAGG